MRVGIKTLSAMYISRRTLPPSMQISNVTIFLQSELTLARNDLLTFSALPLLPLIRSRYEVAHIRSPIFLSTSRSVSLRRSGLLTGVAPRYSASRLTGSLLLLKSQKHTLDQSSLVERLTLPSPGILASRLSDEK